MATFTQATFILTESHFRPVPQNPLTTLHALRCPYFLQRYHSRSYSPAMGNPSDFYGTFMQKFAARMALARKIRREMRDERDMADQVTWKGKGRDIQFGDVVFEHPEESGEEQEARKFMEGAFEDGEFVDGMDMEDEDNTIIEQPQATSSATPISAVLSMSENEMNRAAGLSYIYVADYDFDSADEDSDDDWTGYHDVEPGNPAPVTTQTQNQDNKPDAMIDHSDSSSSNSSDSNDSYVSDENDKSCATIEKKVEMGSHWRSIDAFGGELDFMLSEDAVSIHMTGLIASLEQQNATYRLQYDSHTSLLSRQQGPGNEWLNDVRNICPFTLFLSPSPLANPSGAPALFLTDPDGQTFELVEGEHNFEHPEWEAHFEDRHQRNIDAKRLEHWRREYEETFEEYKNAYKARQYWEKAQKERDEEIKWYNWALENDRQAAEEGCDEERQGEEDGVESTGSTVSAGSLDAEFGDEKEEGSGWSWDDEFEELCERDNKGAQKASSEPDMEKEVREESRVREPRERSFSDPEEYLRTYEQE